MNCFLIITSIWLKVEIHSFCFALGKAYPASTWQSALHKYFLFTSSSLWCQRVKSGIRCLLKRLLNSTMHAIGLVFLRRAKSHWSETQLITVSSRIIFYLLRTSHYHVYPFVTAHSLFFPTVLENTHEIWPRDDLLVWRWARFTHAHGLGFGLQFSCGVWCLVWVDFFVSRKSVVFLRLLFFQ